MMEWFEDMFSELNPVALIFAVVSLLGVSFWCWKYQPDTFRFHVKIILTIISGPATYFLVKLIIDRG